MRAEDPLPSPTPGNHPRVTMRELTSLNLAFSKITSDGVRKLAALPCLTSLAIKGCESVSLAAVERLKREAPALRTVGFSI